MVGLPEDMCSGDRLDRISACDRRTDRQTDGQTSCHGIVSAMRTRRAVKSTDPLYDMLENIVKCPISEIRSTRKCNHYQRVISCLYPLSLVDIHQRVHESPYGELDTYKQEYSETANCKLRQGRCHVLTECM